MNLTATHTTPGPGLVPEQAQQIADAKQFYERYKEWVDEQNHRFDEQGSWNDEFRTW